MSVHLLIEFTVFMMNVIYCCDFVKLISLR